jgi:hypothetical protein
MRPISCSWIHLLLVPAFLAVCPSFSQADTIYKSPGSKGPVYSDTPAPGSRALDLPPPNIAQPPPKPAPPPQEMAGEKPPAPPQAEPYRSFRITQPEDMGSAAADTANFEVRVAVEPPLQTKLGHAFVISLNGRPVGKRYFFNEMLVPPEFFGDTIEVSQRFRLEASIVDRHGKVLMTAQPVEFTMRHLPPRPAHRRGPR